MPLLATGLRKPELVCIQASLGSRNLSPLGVSYNCSAIGPTMDYNDSDSPVLEEDIHSLAAGPRHIKKSACHACRRAKV